MTGTRGLALLMTVAAAGALMSAAARTDSARAVGGARLKIISSRVSSKGASLIVEATEPVAYVATRPNPFTVVVDFRNALSDGVRNSVVSNAKSPISAVFVEPSDAMGT